MSSNSDFDQVLQSLMTFATAPFVFATEAAIREPVIQSIIREGYVLSERTNEAIAEIQETLEDLAAQAQARLANEQPQPATEFQSASGTLPQPDVANAINRIFGTLNKHTHRLTYGAVDLRLLMAIGLAGLSIRQLIEKGIELDDIPWYTLAWYALNSFIQISSDGDPSTADAIAELGNDLAELGED